MYFKYNDSRNEKQKDKTRHVNSNHKSVGMALSISDKEDVKIKGITRVKYIYISYSGKWINLLGRHKNPK